MLSGRMLCMAAMAAGGRCEWKRDSARGFGAFSCADTATIENRTAARTAILRMFKWGLEALVVKECSRIVNGNRMADRTIGASYWGNFAGKLADNFGRLSASTLGFVPRPRDQFFELQPARKSRTSSPGLKIGSGGVCWAAASLRFISSTSCLTHPTLLISIWPSCPIKNKEGTLVRP